MTPLQRQLEQIWKQLRSQQANRADALVDVTIKGLRGIQDLRVPFPFPVTVLAGPNGCGKSTVLFALACAYQVPGARAGDYPSDAELIVRGLSPFQASGARAGDYTPARLFPDFRAQARAANGAPADAARQAEITFSYVTDNQPISMRWARGKDKWNRSFLGRQRGSQPTRELYLRTLASLSNPSEVRSVLQMARRQFDTWVVDASNIAFAQRILSFRYDSLKVLSSGLRDILFAERSADEDGAGANYSEFHMSAGERAVLRLSLSISKLRGALVLIDEIETGLHPYIQQMLMLELQRLALRNQLQIVVTTHSPVILETVPAEARVFLERNPDNVVRREAYRDIMQKSLYGRSQNLLSILCEDEEAEAFVRGALDHLGPELDFLQNDIEVGRDTGKDQFPAHLETFARFRKLRDVVFILDGDARAVGARMQKRAEELGQAATILYLPGQQPPEIWVWELLRQQRERYAPLLGLTAEALAARLTQIQNLYASAADKPVEIAKGQLLTLAEQLGRQTPDLLRIIGKTEAALAAGEVFEFVNQLRDAIGDWRAAGY